MLKRGLAGRKSQIAIFLIIGIVIFIIIISLIYFTGLLKNRQLGDSTIEIQKIPSDLEPFVNYVDACIDTIAKKGIFLLGNQGGYIYQSQDGQYPDATDALGTLFFLYDTHQVPYKIQLPVASLGCDSDLPGYPTVYYIPYPYKNTFDFEEEEYRNDKEYIYLNCFGRQIPLELDDSIRNLKSYMQAKLKKDCNLSVFKNYRFNLSNVTVIIEAKHKVTSFNVTYPMTLTNVNTGAKFSFNNFASTLKFSLKDLYDYINDITLSDVSDPNYDIREKKSLDFDIFVTTDVYNKDDLITVQSDNLKLDGQQFKFYFARQNRYPALEYVYNTTFSNMSMTGLINEFYTYNRQVFINYSSVIHQDIKAVDPDEDEVYITIFGGQGNTRRLMNKTVPYALLMGDIMADNAPPQIMFNITASDGEYIDSQTENYNESFVVQ